MANYNTDPRDLLAVTKALADPNRLRAVMFLQDGELCVCQIVEMLQLAPSTVSKHMAVLHQAHLVDSRKQGRWIYYRLGGTDAPPCAVAAVEWVRRCLGASPQTRQDASRLRKVRGMNKEDLCLRHKGCGRR